MYILHFALTTMQHGGGALAVALARGVGDRVCVNAVSCQFLHFLQLQLSGSSLCFHGRSVCSCLQCNFKWPAVDYCDFSISWTVYELVFATSVKALEWSLKILGLCIEFDNTR